jgi:hypothetical protein
MILQVERRDGRRRRDDVDEQQRLQRASPSCSDSAKAARNRPSPFLPPPTSLLRLNKSYSPVICSPTTMTFTLSTTLPRRSSPPYLPTKDNYTPTHPDCFHIQFADEGEFNSCLKTERVSLMNLTGCREVEGRLSRIPEGEGRRWSKALDSGDTRWEMVRSMVVLLPDGSIGSVPHPSLPLDRQRMRGASPDFARTARDDPSSSWEGWTSCGLSKKLRRCSLPLVLARRCAGSR